MTKIIDAEDTQASPSRLNPFQSAALEVYEEGFHAISKASDIPVCGDLMLRFIMAELSEDCHDLDTAINRIESAKVKIEQNMENILKAFYNMQ